VSKRRFVEGLAQLLVLTLPGAVAANSKGIIDQYGPAKTCFNCHLPGQWMQGTIKLTSPVYTKQKYTFSFTCTGPAGSLPLPIAGINVHTTCGTLSMHPMETKTKLVSGQLTHSQPKAASNNTVTYKFDWTAPASSTGCAFNVTGLLGNNNKLSSGDVTCQAMKGLLVLPTPDGGPPVKKDAGVTPKKDTGVVPKQDTGVTPKQDTGTGPKQDTGSGPTNDSGTTTDGAASVDAAATVDQGGSTPPLSEREGCCSVGAGSRGRGPSVVLALLVLAAFGLLRRRR
jgi:MYXO-CTERM domain-containing protein